MNFEGEKMNTGQRFEVNRVKLSNYIPMDTPMSVTMVPSSYCTFACSFCPAKNVSRPHIMELWMAKQIMNNAGFPRKVKLLSLYNVGEPLINAALPHIIRHCHDTGFAEKTSIVTNASLLTREWSEKLINAGITRIIISLYGLSDAAYWQNTGRQIDFENLKRNILYLNKIKGDCTIFIKATERAVPTPELHRRFEDIFAGNCSGYSVEPILPIWPMFKPEGDDPALRGVGLYPGVPAVERLACHYPFYSMVVNARGLVNPCLADWNETLELGNTFKESLNEIWNSDAYWKFRKTQLKGLRPHHYLCKTCGTLRAATCPEDDIDGARTRLLEKMFPGEKP